MPKLKAVTSSTHQPILKQCGGVCPCGWVFVTGDPSCMGAGERGSCMPSGAVLGLPRSTGAIMRTSSARSHLILSSSSTESKGIGGGSQVTARSVGWDRVWEAASIGRSVRQNQKGVVVPVRWTRPRGICSIKLKQLMDSLHSGVNLKSLDDGSIGRMPTGVSTWSA